MITHFRGRHRFLSNFSEGEVEYDGVIYPTVEHAYQAAKFDNSAMRDIILNTPSPKEAKHLGSSPGCRRDWEDIKLFVMHGLVRQKFKYATRLRELLLETGDADLIEGNTWHDTFWGVCDGTTCRRGPHARRGENFLGQILMLVRDELRGS